MQSSSANPVEAQFWRLPTVMQEVGLCRSEIYRQMGLGAFPKSRSYPGTTKKFWLSTEVQAWKQNVLAMAA